MERRGHRRAGILIAAVLLCWPAGAVGQDADRARDQFRRGVELMEGQSFQEAAEAFRASYDAAPRVATMCNLALAYDRWGAYPDVAADAYERCAREDTSGRYRDHAAERAEELRTQIAASAEPAPTPPEQQLPPDPFVGQPTGPITTPVMQPQPMIPPAGPAPVAGDGGGGGHGLLYAGIGIGVLSAGALVGAIVLAGSANSDADELRRRYPMTTAIPSSDPDSVDLLDSAETKSTWSIALYVIGGATLALATALVLLDVTAPSPEAPSVALAPLDGGALLTTHGSF